MKVSIIIATFGAESWRELALSRAYPSTLNQGAHEVIVGHDPEGTIASVRNELAEKAEGDWLCFLDGDDELAPDYLYVMERANSMTTFSEGKHVLYTPAVSYVTARGKRATPKIWPECDLSRANWLVIGTLVPRELFLEVGGFEDYGWSEDWQLWAKCSKAGARPVKVPEAVYLAHISPSSRNRGQSRTETLYWHQRIGHDVFPELYQALTAQEDERRRLSTSSLRMQ